MKKLLSISFILASLILLFSNTPSYAQGTFECRAVPRGGCDVDSASVDCETGHRPDRSYCTAFYGESREACDNAPAAKCVLTNETEHQSICAGNGINTAIGCIPVGDTNDFVGFFLGWAVGIGGGIAFLLIVYSGFQIMTSSGNPERLQAGRELLTSAIAGLILIIFSVFILRIVGVNILGIPGIQ